MISTHQKEILLAQLMKLKPLRIGIFGSYSRGENTNESDLDILIHLDYSKNVSLLTLSGVELDLTEKLGVKVDLITEGSLSPYIRPYIEKDIKYIFG